MEKLKTQLESARKAKENRAAQQPGKSDRVSGGVKGGTGVTPRGAKRIR